MRNDVISLEKYLSIFPLECIFLGFESNSDKIQQKWDQTVTKKLIVYKARI